MDQGIHIFIVSYCSKAHLFEEAAIKVPLGTTEFSVFKISRGQIFFIFLFLMKCLMNQGFAKQLGTIPNPIP